MNNDKSHRIAVERREKTTRTNDVNRETDPDRIKREPNNVPETVPLEKLVHENPQKKLENTRENKRSTRKLVHGTRLTRAERKRLERRDVLAHGHHSGGIRVGGRVTRSGRD